MIRNARYIIIIAAVTALGGAAIMRFGHRRSDLSTARTSKPAGPKTVQQTGTDDAPSNPDVQILIDNAKAGYWVRVVHATEKLPNDLSTGDFRQLLALSVGKRPEKIESTCWDASVNDIWNLLRRQKSYPPEFADKLMAYFQAQDTGPVLKDYAVQHLGSWINAGLPAGEGEKDLAKRKEILKFLVGVTKMHRESYAGTALYSISCGLTNDGEPEATMPELVQVKASYVKILKEAALSLVDDSHASVLARISAVQIFIEYNDRAALKPIRQIASDVNAAPMLRASSIAYLARLGDKSDVTLLEGISKNCTDSRLLCALRPALEQLLQKTKGS